MSYKVITISREFGSGGRTVGKQLAESWVFLATTEKSLKK